MSKHGYILYCCIVRILFFCVVDVVVRIDFESDTSMGATVHTRGAGDEPEFENACKYCK